MTNFETKTCPRCHGTGEHSSCESYGTICFQCRGARIVLTARGEAARAYLTTLKTKAAGDLIVGDVIEPTEDGLRPVTIRTITGEDRLTITGEDDNGQAVRYYGMPSNRRLPVTMDQAAREAALQAALAYQASLTATGKPRKSHKTKTT